MEWKLMPILLCMCKFIVTTSDSLDYYEQLIKKEIEKSSRYTFPKDASAYFPKNEGNPVFFGNFDYIIIGAGSTGSVVASRISEISTWKILLLEAGKEENDFTDIPSMSAYSLKSEYNWGFNSTPQSTCCLANNGVCSYPRGKALGGTTVLNSLVYSRGNALDYNKWADKGNPDWTYEKVLPYFMMSENAHFFGDLGYHGLGGYLNVEHRHPLSNRTKAYIKANLEKGLPVGDYNGRNQLQVGPTQFTALKGRRVSSAKAFLQPAYNRSNLFILTGSYVTKILLTEKFKKTYGVVFANKNVQYYATVKNEVILSAGVVGSPQILMLSGIGPAANLQKLGIPVQANLGVGKTMHDHLAFYYLLFTTPLTEPLLTLKQAIRQYLRGTGPFTISTLPQSISFHVLKDSNSTVPDFEIVFTASTKKGGIQTPKMGVGNDNTSHPEEDAVFKIIVVLLHPKTRGSITLHSKNPYAYPLINAKCLDDRHNEDIEKMYKGIQIVLDLMETDAFKNLKSKMIPYLPCSSNLYLSKAYWMCVIRQTAINAYHGGGTCKMGSNPLNGDVVDNDLRVYGTSNLRVADASVIPVTLSAHMSAPAMMIGEKLADLIKNGKSSR